MSGLFPAATSGFSCRRDIFAPMPDLVVEVPTSRESMTEIRPELEAALEKLVWVACRWEDDVLHLEGPGARGTVELAQGKLVGRASLWPPASFLRETIEEIMRSGLLKAARA